MSGKNDSDSSTSSSELSASSSNFDPLKALYSKKVKVPVKSAPLYENLSQFESAQKNAEIIPVGQTEMVRKREEEKKRVKEQREKELQEQNKQRFAEYRDLLPTRKERRQKNVLTRMERMEGPLAALRNCVDNRLRVKIITRSAKSIRGVLHATLVAFDKQWNLALTDVLEIWKKKAVNKRKIPPAFGTPVPKGTAAKISPVPVVTETPLGHGVWECTRHLPQLLVRGEHVVLINIVERLVTELSESSNELTARRRRYLYILQRTEISHKVMLS